MPKLRPCAEPTDGRLSVLGGVPAGTPASAGASPVRRGVFAFAVRFVLAGLYFLAGYLSVKLGCPVPVWSGAMVFAGGVGLAPRLLLSASFPPQ